MNSPLITNEYFFPITQVIAEPKFDDADNDINNIEYEIKTDLGKDEQEEDNKYQLSIEISSIHPTDESEKRKAYRVHLVAIGVFEVHPNWPDPEKLVRINGASILYSAAREFLITITSRGPWGALMLPTINFNNSIGTEKEEKK